MDEAMDVARSAPQGTHCHADVIYMLPYMGTKMEACSTPNWAYTNTVFLYSGVVTLTLVVHQQWTHSKTATRLIFNFLNNVEKSTR